MTSLFPPLGRWGFGFALILSLFALGCEFDTAEDVEAPDLSKLVPAKGTVKINGKPLAGVVVTFLPKKWGASNGETQEDGSFVLETAGRSGAFPGSYKVALSYLVSADGEPQGLAARSSMSPPPGMTTAREKFPRTLSSLDQTKLKAVIGASGGSYDFSVDVDLNAPEAAAKTDSATSPPKS